MNAGAAAAAELMAAAVLLGLILLPVAPRVTWLLAAAGHRGRPLPDRPGQPART